MFALNVLCWILPRAHYQILYIFVYLYFSNLKYLLFCWISYNVKQTDTTMGKISEKNKSPVPLLMANYYFIFLNQNTFYL